MGLLASAAAAVLAISFMTFVTFFGRLPAFRHTPVAWLHRAIWVYIPNGLAAVDDRIAGGRILSSCSRFGHYIWYDRHPTVLIFFILLLAVGEFLFLPAAWPLLPAHHKLLSSVAVILPCVFLYLSAAADPGVITPANHPREMSRYPYDFVLFHPGHWCRTCGLLKPARSKHCSICRACVSRADHHCIFINSCVGSGNTHWFVLLLLTTALLTAYGGALGISLMGDKIRVEYPEWTLIPWGAFMSADRLAAAEDAVAASAAAAAAAAAGAAGGEPAADAPMRLRIWLIIVSWALQLNVGLGASTLLATLTSPLVWGLFSYHVYLIYCGTTTNESLKWADWRAEMADGYVFKRALPPTRIKDLRFEPAWTRWPNEADQIVVLTNDAKPPPANPAANEENGTNHHIQGEGPWEPLRRLRDVDNLYDIGFLGNLKDVSWPAYVFRVDTEVEEGGKRGTRYPRRRRRGRR